MEDSQDLSPTSSSQRVSITAIIIYVLLALTASISIGVILSWLFTFNMSDFEGRSGSAAILFFMLTAPISFLVSLIALPIMIKKAPKILPTVMWVFAGLTLLLGFFN